MTLVGWSPATFELARRATACASLRLAVSSTYAGLRTMRKISRLRSFSSDDRLLRAVLQHPLS